MLSSASAHGKEYLAFALSCVVIAAHWRVHHEIFRYVRSLSGPPDQPHPGLAAHAGPDAVRDPGAHRRRRLSPGSACTRSCWSRASASFALIIREIRREHLYRTDLPPRVFAQSLVRSICLAAVFGVSVPASFLTTSTGAYLCWLAAPIVLAVARGLQGRAVQ